MNNFTSEILTGFSRNIHMPTTGRTGRIWLINQTGRRLAPFDGTKYSRLAACFINDRRIEVCNKRELLHPPTQLPYFERDIAVDGSGASHKTVAQPEYLSDQHHHIHLQYFRAVIKEAQQMKALPVVLANPHEATLGFYQVMAEIFPDLNLAIADMHLDASSSGFSSSGFLRYGIGKKHVDPKKVQIFGANRFISPGRFGQPVEVVVNNALTAKFPAWLMEIINLEPKGSFPDIDHSRLLEACVATAKIAAPDIWDDQRIALESRHPVSAQEFLYKIALIWTNTYLHKNGVWVDNSQPSNRFDYQGKPLFVSFDADVSGVRNRSADQAVADYIASVKTGKVAGIHITEVETPLTKWSAENIYQAIQGFLV